MNKFGTRWCFGLLKPSLMSDVRIECALPGVRQNYNKKKINLILKLFSSSYIVFWPLETKSYVRFSKFSPSPYPLGRGLISIPKFKNLFLNRFRWNLLLEFFGLLKLNLKLDVKYSKKGSPSERKPILPKEKKPSNLFLLNLVLDSFLASWIQILR